MNMTPKSFLRPNPTLFSIKPKGLKIEKLLFGCKKINNLRILLRQLEFGYARTTYQDTPYLHKLPHNSLLNFQAVRERLDYGNTWKSLPDGNEFRMSDSI